MLMISLYCIKEPWWTSYNSTICSASLHLISGGQTHLHLLIKKWPTVLGVQRQYLFSLVLLFFRAIQECLPPKLCDAITQCLLMIKLCYPRIVQVEGLVSKKTRMSGKWLQTILKSFCESWCLMSSISTKWLKSVKIFTVAQAQLENKHISCNYT